MICPRCSVAQISPETQKCVLCGYSVVGGVIVQHPVADEIQETVQTELEGRFQLQVLLRREPRSILYLARDVEEERLVSLRLLPLPGPVDGEVLQRFEQSAVAASGFRRPHIVPVLKYGLSRSLLWYSMDAMKGRTLAAVLQDADGPMGLAACLELLEQLASGLEYVHRRGVIHGDVKPANILIDAEGWARLADVGIIHGVARAGGTAPEWRRLLSARFMAPEQFERRHVGPAADQFALAAVAHEFLTGTSIRPGSRRGGDETEDVPFAPPPTVIRTDQLSAPVAGAIERALSPDPAARFKSVLDFVAVLSGDEFGTTTAPTIERPSRASSVVTIPTSRRRIPWKILGAVATVTVLAGAVALGLRQPTVVGIRPQADAATPLARLSRPTLEDPAPPAVRTPTAPAPAAPVTERSAPAARPEPTRAPVAVTPATLFVNARPWGVLSIDGVRIGNTPRANLAVAPGRHVLRIERDGFVPFERTVDLTAGAELRLTDIVLEPIAP